MIKMNQKARRVLLMFSLNRCDMLFRGAVCRLCREHDGGAVGVVCADITAYVAA